ncbi:MAG TPA: amidohydrolase family protein [Pyrinomonadaceae bacterium]|nr:amidohydrolase family protein [Pyrinomonadaceae bacterium]
MIKIAFPKACSFLLLFALHLSLFAQTRNYQPSNRIAITHVTVIDATGAAAQADMTVVVTGDRITAVGRSASVKVPRGAMVVDGTGKFLIPGLWDMHVHTASSALTKNPKIFFPLFLANGITGVRDMGGDLQLLQQWRASIARGEMIGPYIVAAGPMLDGPIGPSSLSITNESEAREAVVKLKQQGADFIKVQELLPRVAYFAVADEARRQGMTFVGHVPESISAQEASDAGQRSIEHLTGILRSSSSEEDLLEPGWRGIKHLLDTFDEQKARSLFARFVKNRTWQCPTLVWERGYFYLDRNGFTNDSRLKYIPHSWQEVIWGNFAREQLRNRTDDDARQGRRRFQLEMQVVREMRRAGVEFLAGTDTPAPGIFPGFSLHDELALLVESGLTPMEALQAATRNAAKFLGLLSTRGTVERGKVADMVLLEANPLEDIRNTRRIEAVVVGGRLLAKSDLQAMLAGVEEEAARQR